MARLRIILSIIALAVVIVLPTGAIEADRQAQVMEPSAASVNPGNSCHFGVAAVNSASISMAGYDLSILGVGNYLDWGRTRSTSVPANIDYYYVLNVADSVYDSVKAQLASLVTSHLGATWLVGNEPDSEVTYQDHISAVTYGDRYYALATIIRNNDPSAKIGFGTVIQPTPIRLHYLTLAMNELEVAAGGLTQAHALIDIYSIHAFILNEQPLYDYSTNPPTNINWGAGEPVGYDTSWPAPEVVDLNNGETYKVYDATIFEQRVTDLRTWMKDQGEQNKPLWITEFGVLFPSAGNIYLQVSDADTANYMTQVFDFMLGTKNTGLGYAGDDYRLVQKWDWYSLNQAIDTFGGSFFDPTNRTLTPVGQHFLLYEPSLAAVPASNPDVYVQADTLSITPFSPSNTPGLVNYKFSLKFGNYFNGDRSTGVKIEVFDGSTSNPPIYSTQTNLPRCGGSFDAAFLMDDLTPGNFHTYIARISLLDSTLVDTNTGNNEVTFGSLPLPVPVTYPAPDKFFPMILK